MKLTLVFVLICAAPALGQDRGEEILLWRNGAPGSEGVAAVEVSRPSTNPQYKTLPEDFSVTHYPSIFVFLPPVGKGTGAAVIVAPGGGHTHLVMDKEGWEMAEWLNQRGIAAFVLKYRLARTPGSKYKLDNEVFQDATRAMRLVRSRAKEWGLNPAKVGFLGFSAGGEVAGMIGTKYDSGKAAAVDPIERVSSRPDFSILIYPYYRPGSAPVAGSPLTKSDALAPIVVNKEFPIPNDAPPVFMVCASDDPSHVVPTVKFYLELQAKRIPAEMLIYDYGEHGFGLRPTKKPGSPVESWPLRLADWLAARGISKPI